MKKDLFTTLRKYIGPIEMVVIVVLMIILTIWMDHQEKKEMAREQLIEELQRYTAERKLMQMKSEEYSQPIDMDVKVLDSIYAPYMIDSLCRYVDSTFTQGYITMSKQAPYQKLIAPKDSFYMWILLEQYFPEGKLVNVNGIAQDDKIIQFHFTIDQEEQTLEGMMHKLESTLQELQRQQPGNAESR